MPWEGSGGALDLAKLGVLGNYVAKTTGNGVPLETFRVHSPTDWEVFTGNKTIPLLVNVGGWEYLHVPHLSGSRLTYSWQRSGRAQAYSASPYPSYANGFAALSHVTGVKLVRGGPCDEAHLVGRLWHFAAAAKGAVYPHVSACIADRSGALLSYDEGTSGVGAPKDLVATFTVVGVDDVGVIRAP